MIQRGISVTDQILMTFRLVTSFFHSLSVALMFMYQVRGESAHPQHPTRISQCIVLTMEFTTRRVLIASKGKIGEKVLVKEVMPTIPLAPQIREDGM